MSDQQKLWIVETLKIGSNSRSPYDFVARGVRIRNDGDATSAKPETGTDALFNVVKGVYEGTSLARAGAGEQEEAARRVKAQARRNLIVHVIVDAVGVNRFAHCLGAFGATAASLRWSWSASHESPSLM